MPTSPSHRRVFVHIGRNKTGSTAIQSALSKRRSALRDAGYDFPGAGLDHGAIVYALSPTAMARLAEADREKRMADAAALRASVDEHDRHVIISSEGLGNVHPRRLKEWLGEIEPTIVVYIREQVEYLASSYQQVIKGDLETCSFDEYASRFTVDYEKILANWEAVFGRDNLIVRVYGKSAMTGGDVVTDFLEVVGISDVDKFKIDEPNTNPSIRGAMLEAKRAINGCGFSFQEMIQGTYRALLEIGNSYDEYRGSIGILPDFVESQRAIYRESNANVARRYFNREELFPISSIAAPEPVSQDDIRHALGILLERAAVGAPDFVAEAKRRLDKSLVPEERKPTEYEQRVAGQLRQFADLKVLPTLPPIYFHWMKTYVTPRLKEATGYASIFDLYEDQLAHGIQQGTSGLIVSLGSGDCNVEEAIARKLLKRGISDFRLVCTELSQARLDRAAERIKGSDVEGRLEFAVADLNDWTPPGQLDGVIAHHTLHHIVELETLFDRVAEALAPTGRFVTADMIGRNGHMRWPEAETIINKLWPLIPDEFKFQHQFKKFHQTFVNWDCSTKGFEGIRAQDILALLVERFDFSHFFAYGNLPDVFIERGYGHNLALDDPRATGLVDLLEHLNETMIDVGALKPTVMMATMRKRGTMLGESLRHKHWTPRYCIRRP